MRTKKYVLLTLVLGVVTLSEGMAQSGQMSMISGTMNRGRVEKAILYKVVEGQRVEFASQTLNDEGEFAFAVPSPESGFYYLDDGKDGASNRMVRLYLKGGEKLNYKIDADSYQLTTSSPENKLLDKWQKMVHGLKKASRLGDTATYRSFFPALNALLPKAEAFKQRIRTPDEKFNRLLRFAVGHDIESSAMALLLTPRTAHPTKDQYPAYYKSILKSKKFCGTKILRFANGLRTMSLYTTFQYLMNYKKGKAVSRDQGQRFINHVNLFCNDTVRGAFIVKSLGAFKTYDDLVATMKPLKKYLVTDRQKQGYLKYEKSVRSFAKGTPALNFAYPDINGDTVSLRDLRGNVVVIDMWATWCGPCRQQLPFLDSLETQMKGKDVAFVSISIDEKEDIDKWKEMVKEKEMQGYQLIAPGWENEMVKYYNVKGIPRFMVFDKKGDIVTIDAPRPSTPDLKALIIKTLQEG